MSKTLDSLSTSERIALRREATSLGLLALGRQVYAAGRAGTLRGTGPLSESEALAAVRRRVTDRAEQLGVAAEYRRGPGADGVPGGRCALMGDLAVYEIV